MAPRWVVRLLERTVDPADQDEVIGDLEEVHRRRVARYGALVARFVTAADGLALVVGLGCGRVIASVRQGGWTISSIEARLALRLALRQPVMTLTAVVALGIGIGIAAGGFSVLRQGLYNSLPWDDDDRWVVIETYTEEERRRSRMDLERLRAFRGAATAFAHIAGAEAVSLNVVDGDGRVARVAGARITPGIFAHLPYVPLTGRLLSTTDGIAGAERVVLIRESLWERSYGRAPEVVGRSLNVGGVGHRIVGVLPDDAGYPSEGEIWLPLDEETMDAPNDLAALPGTRQTAILAEGATIAQATEQLNRISSAVAQAGSGIEAQTYTVVPITRTIASGDAHTILLLVTGILLAFLSVIAANVSNLLSARTALRSSELAVRTALGASRGRIVSQLFAEVVVLAVPAALLGLALAAAVLSVYDRVLDELPFWVHLHLDPWTATTVVGFALVASAVMGLAPALQATRSAPASALQQASGRTTRGIGRLGGAMIAAEVAISVALLGTGVVFVEGFRAYVDPVVELPDERVLTARLTLDFSERDLVPGGSATVQDSTRALLASVREVTMALPGVRAVGFTSHLPRAAPYPEPIEVEGRTDFVRAGLAQQSPGLFEVLEVEPVAGRDLSEDDLSPDAPRVVVVNEAFAVAAFGTTRAIGRRVRPSAQVGEDAGPWHTIVGVVPDVMEVTRAGGAATLYLPMGAPRFVSLAARVDDDPMPLSGVLRRAAFDLDPELDVSAVARLDQVGAENRVALQAMSGITAAIGLTTLLLSLVGIYAIVSLAVTQRTREIGVRVALGAEPAAILRSVLTRTTILVVIGGALGALAGRAFAAARLFVFALPDPSPWLFPGLVAAMAIVAGLACWVPVRRALSIQPIDAM